MGSVVLDSVTKVYRGGTVAVRSLSLGIEPGRFFVLLGPSGCGKTTLLRIVAGLEHPSEGRVFIDGHDVTEKSPKDRDVAMVFQQYSLYPHMTVEDNIAFGLQSRRLRKEEVRRRVREVASILEVEPLLRKKPRALSGGQQQRVAMGRALVRDPAAFLMDEPLSNLDARLRVQMRAEIARIQREVGVTTVYVTHDQTEAMTLGDEVAVLRDGTVQQIASPAELYRAPRNLFVAGFVGSPPMNLAEATVEESDGDLFIRFSGHRVRVEPAVKAALHGHAWRQVVVGVRPEDLDDAAALRAPSDARLHLEVERRESIGADVYLYFRVDAPLLLAEDPRDPSGEQGDGTWAAERTNLWMARTSSTGARAGETVELAARPGRLYLFDPRSGAAIGR